MEAGDENDDSPDEMFERRRQDSDEEASDVAEELPLPQNAEAGDDEEVDESPSTQEEYDAPFESLRLYDDAYAWLLDSAKKYAIISVIGKSRFGKSLPQVLLPLLRPKRDFRRVATFDECAIDAYWCSDEQAIFLVPKAHGFLFL